MFFSKKDKERLFVIERILVRIHREVDEIKCQQKHKLKELEIIMSGINEKIDEIVAAEGAEAVVVAAIKTSVDALKAAIEAFIAANPGANTAGLQSAIDSANANIAAATAVKSEVEGVTSEVPVV